MEKVVVALLAKHCARFRALDAGKAGLEAYSEREISSALERDLPQVGSRNADHMHCLLPHSFRVLNIVEKTPHTHTPQNQQSHRVKRPRNATSLPLFSDSNPTFYGKPIEDS
jgi:hypothetical protein